jgi:hypothetical protein
MCKNVLIWSRLLNTGIVLINNYNSMKVSDICYDSVLSLEYSLKQITDAELNSAIKQLPQLTPAQAKLEMSRADKWQDMISK